MAPIRHYEMSRAQRLFSIASIAGASVLLALVAGRLATHVDLHWWMVPAFAAGVAVADLASGLVHWAADTWGRDDLPVIGRRLLVPFRLHHVDPHDFLRRGFADANGDVAFLSLLPLAGLLALPLEPAWAPPAAVFGFGLVAVGMWTNQVHQWAHMPSPPLVIRCLQDGGLLLGRGQHAVHHHGSYDAHYCITTGWWNRPLEAIGFFRRLEVIVTRLTGARPREDDRRYAASVTAAGPAPPATQPRAGAV